MWSNGSTVIQTETWNADGTINNVHYYDITGQPYTDYDVVYANNQPVSATYSNGMTETWTYASDGSANATGSTGVSASTNTLQELTYEGIAGQKYTSTDTLYGDNGKPVSEVWANGATTIQTEAWNSDGTINNVHYYDISGQPYTDYDVAYANNKPVSAAYSNGMTETWSYNTDGSSEASLNNVEGQSYTASASIYDPNENSNGHLAAQAITNANGSETLNSYENGLTITVGSGGATFSLPAPAGDSFNFAFNETTTINASGTNEKLFLTPVLEMSRYRISRPTRKPTAKASRSAAACSAVLPIFSITPYRIARETRLLRTLMAMFSH